MKFYRKALSWSFLNVLLFKIELLSFMVQFVSFTRLSKKKPINITHLIRNNKTFDLMKNIMQNFHLELQRILLSIQMVFYGVFILWKFITQSLDEPERQIIHFFAYNCLAEGLCLLLKESIQYSAKYITFYEPFHYGNKHWNSSKEKFEVKDL